MRRTLARRGAGILAIAVLSACLLHPAAVWAADGTFDASVQRIANGTFDVLILRPTGLAVLVVGVGLFVPAAIVSSPGGKTPILEAWDRFVVRPANYAVTRPLGDF
jgi:ABC-type transport system involved in cytochrome c biogenesis permease component